MKEVLLRDVGERERGRGRERRGREREGEKRERQLTLSPFRTCELNAL
jgi:hypothetical protein